MLLAPAWGALPGLQGQNPALLPVLGGYRGCWLTLSLLGGYGPFTEPSFWQ